MVHKRPKIALNHVVSVTGYSLSFILLCLAASIQMRWTPGGFIQTAKADRCVLPTDSEHLKLAENGGSAAENSSSFMHAALRKGDLLPRFATTRVVKQSRPVGSQPAGSGAKQVSVLSQKQNQKSPDPQPESVAALVTQAHHTPPEAKSAAKAGPRIAALVARERAAPRPHHTPPVREDFGTKAAPVLRAHHTPPLPDPALALKLSDDLDGEQPKKPITTSKIPTPSQKPAVPRREAGTVGTIITPARAEEPARRQAPTKPIPTPTAAGFAVSQPEDTRQLAAYGPEKAPIVRPKPSKAFRPVHQSRCLALALYYEAGKDGEEAQIGLAKVIMSRVKSKNYPNTICGVVYQNAHLRGNCAFSFACDGRPEHPHNKVAWAKSRILALSTLCGDGCAQPNGESAAVHNVHKRAQRRASNSHRQVTDRQMKHMGRDGVNSFSTSTAPVF